MAQRYTYDLIFGVIPDVEGGIVFYEDYEKLEAELQKYKDEFPDYVECVRTVGQLHMWKGWSDVFGN